MYLWGKKTPKSKLQKRKHWRLFSPKLPSKSGLTEIDGKDNRAHNWILILMISKLYLKHKHTCESSSRCWTWICFHNSKACFAYESLLTSFGGGFFSSRCLVLYRRNLHLSTYDLKHSCRGGLNWEIGTDIYTLLILCIKSITNESLLYSTGNSTQCSVVT